MSDLQRVADGDGMRMPQAPDCHADHTAIFCRFADALATLIAAARLRTIQRRSA